MLDRLDDWQLGPAQKWIQAQDTSVESKILDATARDRATLLILIPDSILQVNLKSKI